MIRNTESLVTPMAYMVDSTHHFLILTSAQCGATIPDGKKCAAPPPPMAAAASSTGTACPHILSWHHLLGHSSLWPSPPPLFFKLPGIATEKLPNVQSPQPIHAYPFKLDQTGASKWRLSSTLKLKLGCCVLFFRHYACSLGTRLILNPNNFPLNQILKVVIATTMLG